MIKETSVFVETRTVDTAKLAIWIVLLTVRATHSRNAVVLTGIRCIVPTLILVIIIISLI